MSMLDSYWEEEGFCEIAPQKIDIPPSVMVIFGSTGDLAKRKILPALYHLEKDGFLPKDDFTIIAFGRRKYTNETFRNDVSKSIQDFSRTTHLSEEDLHSLLNKIEYHQGEFDDSTSFEALSSKIEKLGRKNILFYLATAPDYFVPLAAQLGKHNLGSGNEGFSSRLIVEKPFGHDLESARSLNEGLREYFKEKDIFRIDHYLGKETVQNLMYFRFANSIFEPLWNRNYIDHVQISVLEKVDASGRGGYYDKSGASRDMLQNHLMQLMCLVGMEPPVSLEADSIRKEKIKVFHSLPRFLPESLSDHSVRAQYKEYLEHSGVASNSKTETYVALKLGIDNWRWAGTPFYLQTGKALHDQVTEINLFFKRPPQVLFAGFCGEKLKSNRLTLRIQPNESIDLSFNSKIPGRRAVCKSSMNFSFRENKDSYFPEAYERLLMDALNGDATLFTHWEEVEESWKLIDSLREGWDSRNKPVFTYPSGSWGPLETAEFMKKDNRQWDFSS